MGALNFIMGLLALLPDAIRLTQLGMDIAEKISDLRASGKEPTPAQWSALNKSLADLTAELNTDPPEPAPV